MSDYLTGTFYRMPVNKLGRGLVTIVIQVLVIVVLQLRLLEFRFERIFERGLVGMYLAFGSLEIACGVFRSRGCVILDTI